jgi:hypothetical protein
MMTLRLLCLAGLVALLTNCAEGRTQHAQGCSQIPEKSTGACRVGLGPKSYYDSSWKSQ